MEQTTPTPTRQRPLSEEKAATRAAWALGDYHRFATRLVWSLGDELVASLGDLTGRRVLDVAAGTGNTAIRAALAGAEVVASDLTPENFRAGREEARRRGVEVDWIEGDAECLPFGDSEFDVVTSSVGAIFAPRHQRVADEMLRVCRPGGRIGMINFTPESVAADFFAVFAEHLPPPLPGAQPPVLWGDESHVRELFADRVASLEMTRDFYVERAATPREYCDFVKQTFGPVVAIFSALQGELERSAALDEAFLAFATEANRAPQGAPAELPYEYLKVLAVKA